MSATCLIAEADPFIANLLLRFAEESGLHSARAKTGQEVLALAQKSNLDVLIVEPELPGEVRGWEAVRALRTEAQAKAENIGRDSTSTLTSTPAVISCSWLEKAEAGKLLGDVAWHLQKPNLFYCDFIEALDAAGVTVEDRPGPSDLPCG